jgi:hypothetical protein
VLFDPQRHEALTDVRWNADRARAFAMHAIAQSERHTGQHGMRRYSLWTGDLGLAVYLGNCLTGGDQWPNLDSDDRSWTSERRTADPSSLHSSG